MASSTPRLALRKPDTTDLVNVVADLDANFDLLDTQPGGNRGYAQAVASQTPITVLVDLAGLSVGPVTFIANRRVRVKGRILAQSTVASDIVFLLIVNDVGAAVASTRFQLGLANQPLTVDVEAIIIPAAGARTYKMQLQRLVGTGTIQMTASASEQAFLEVEDIGV
jgi:hypothetical protein